MGGVGGRPPRGQEMSILRRGMKGMSSRQQKMLMKRAGLNIESVDDVREVVIRTGEGDYVFKRPEVSIMVMQGVRTWQVVGEPEKRAPGSAGGKVEREGEGQEGPSPGEEAEEAAPSIPAEDVALVAQQAGVSEQEALDALTQCNGNPAEAIIKLMK